MNNFRIIIFGVLIAFYSLPQAEVYKWVDENGKTHFGDKPPDDPKVSVEKKKVKPIRKYKDLTPEEREKLKAVSTDLKEGMKEWEKSGAESRQKLKELESALEDLKKPVADLEAAIEEHDAQGN